MQTSSRHSRGFGYIGFGNNPSTFNQKKRILFSVYKEKLDFETHLPYKMDFLHQKLKKEGKLKKQERNYLLKQQLLALSFLLLLPILLTI